MRRMLLLTCIVFFCWAKTTPAQSDPFVGQIEIVGFNFAPVGWAFCDGSLLPISQNTALFSLLGTFYGGDGIRTFALPDLRGRMAIGQGQGPGLSSMVIGEIGGEEQVTLTLNQIPTHNHVAMGASASADGLSPTSDVWGTTTVYLYSSTGSSLVGMNPGAIGSVGGGLPHENRSPYLVMNFIIALEGVYPARD